MSARTLIRLPDRARRGEVIAIQAAIQHPMETGHRPGADGQVLPRDLIRRFELHYDGEVVFAADLRPAVAANPYLAFTTVATVTGELSFRWRGDKGFVHEETRRLVVDA